MDRAQVEHVGLHRYCGVWSRLANPGHVAQDSRAEQRRQDHDGLESSPFPSARVFTRIQFAAPLALPAQAGTATACPEAQRIPSGTVLPRPDWLDSTD